MQSNKYKIGENYFKTQDQAKQYIRNIINELLVGEEINESHEKYATLMEIVSNHRDFQYKRGVGIKYFYIVLNPLNKCRELNICRKDNTNIVISYVVCAEDSIIDKSRMKVHDVRFKLYQAMRNAINDQIIEFKNTSVFKCVQCSNDDEETEYHVDHHNPSFMEMRDSYLEGKVCPTRFDYIDRLNISKFKEQDIQFASEWREYHRTNANLQILCKSCNLRKPKKDNIIPLNIIPLFD
jgi:hypothetical protein